MSKNKATVRFKKRRVDGLFSPKVLVAEITVSEIFGLIEDSKKFLSDLTAKEFAQGFLSEEDQIRRQTCHGSLYTLQLLIGEE